MQCVCAPAVVNTVQAGRYLTRQLPSSNMAKIESSLPILDMVKAKGPHQRLEVAKQLVHALETVGFVYIDNVEGFHSQKLEEHTRWLFGLPEEVRKNISKKAWNPSGKNQYRGFSQGDPTKGSYKEAYEICQEPSQLPQSDPSIHPFFKETNLWPDGVEGADKFKAYIMEHYKAMLGCGLEILRLASLGCGREETWFESLVLPGTVSTIALLRYPLRPGAPPPAAMDGDVALCCQDHADSVLVTLLDTFDFTGLQIWRDDAWMEVPVRRNSLVMNIGQTLAAISGGRLKATRHRVRDLRVDRYSVPFFLEPRYDGDLSCRMFGDDEGVDNSVQNGGNEAIKHYGPWLIDKMRNKPEYRDFVALEFSEV